MYVHSVALPLAINDALKVPLVRAKICRTAYRLANETKYRSLFAFAIERIETC